MSAANPAGDSPRLSRRSILYATTAAMGAAGLAAVAWPFIDQFNPDAAVRASGNVPHRRRGGGGARVPAVV